MLRILQHDWNVILLWLLNDTWQHLQMHPKASRLQEGFVLFQCWLDWKVKMRFLLVSLLAMLHPPPVLWRDVPVRVCGMPRGSCFCHFVPEWFSWITAVSIIVLKWEEYRLCNVRQILEKRKYQGCLLYLKLFTTQGNNSRYTMQEGSFSFDQKTTYVLCFRQHKMSL